MARITKVCTRTGLKVTGNAERIAQDFYRDKSQKDGFSPWCKAAEREYNRAYNKAKKEAGVARKADADEQGVVTFDNTMQSEGARSERKRGTTSKVEKASKGRASSAPKKQIARAPRKRAATRTPKVKVSA